MSSQATNPDSFGLHDATAAAISQDQTTQGSQSQELIPSSTESQETNATNYTDRVFTPPASDSEKSVGNSNGNGHASSQESTLMQLSELAAQQEKMTADKDANAALPKKRMADGMIKHTRDGSSTSPVRMGHSRNTSTVSMASTAGSRVGELSAELKTRLSYAMLKVNNGWQSHSIDEVESLASQAASPTSSTSTIPGRQGASASPHMALASMRHLGNHVPTLGQPQPPQARTYESFWRDNNSRSQYSPISPAGGPAPSLAPPAAIQPGQPNNQYTARRNSNPKYTPPYLSHSHQASPRNGPLTPGYPSSLQSTPNQQAARTPQIDPILFSPHQNVREQEALETLVFMSSPGNSANLKHSYPASQPSNLRNGVSNQQRTALPTSRLGPNGEPRGPPPRKALPTHRPSASQSQAQKRVGFEKTPGNAHEAMDVDEPHHTGRTPRSSHAGKKVNGGTHAPRPALSVPSGINASSRSRPMLKDDDIERMLDQVAADDDSDSDGEIQIPAHGAARRGGAASIGA